MKNIVPLLMIFLMCLVILLGFTTLVARQRMLKMEDNLRDFVRKIEDDTGAVIKFEYHKEQDQLYIWTQYSWGTTTSLWDKTTPLNGSIVTTSLDGMTMIMSMILNPPE